MSTARSGLSSRILGAGLLTAETSREGDRATTLELFFDLVYAFAFTQVTALMVHHQTAGGVLQGIVILLLSGVHGPRSPGSPTRPTAIAESCGSA